MKLQKLFVQIVSGWVLLVASSGIVMAEGCGDGVIDNETFPGNLIISDELSCVIKSSTINGTIRVTDTANVLLLNNQVGGGIKVIRTEGQVGMGVANVVDNIVVGGNLIVAEYATANVIGNKTLALNIRVDGNTKAIVRRNTAAKSVICKQNTVLSVFFNFAAIFDNCDPLKQ